MAMFRPNGNEWPRADLSVGTEAHMTDPIKTNEDLERLQREADREKSDWPDADETKEGGGARPGPDTPA